MNSTRSLKIAESWLLSYNCSQWTVSWKLFKLGWILLENIPEKMKEICSGFMRLKMLGKKYATAQLKLIFSINKFLWKYDSIKYAIESTVRS